MGSTIVAILKGIAWTIGKSLIEDMLEIALEKVRKSPDKTPNAEKEIQGMIHQVRRGEKPNVR